MRGVGIVQASRSSQWTVRVRRGGRDTVVTAPCDEKTANFHDMARVPWLYCNTLQYRICILVAIHVTTTLTCCCCCSCIRIISYGRSLQWRKTVNRES